MLPLNEVKSWLGVTGFDNDVELQSLIDRAQAFIERETHWYFGDPRSADEVKDGTGTALLFLRQFPVSEDSVVVYERAGITDAWEATDTDDYEVAGRIIGHASRWTKGRRNYRVTYQEGFINPPGDVSQLLLDLVQKKWREVGERTDLKSEKIGDYSYVRGDLTELDSWNIVKVNWQRQRLG